MRTIAGSLSALALSAASDLVLVAPFIKSQVLDDILSKAPPEVTVLVATRWLPYEISSGVSDIEAWDVVRSRPNSSLWLRQDLHAKYYRGDRTCLIGSANLTRAALGLSSSPNLELLLSVDAGTPGLTDFEDILLAGAIEVDDTLAESMRKAVEFLPVPAAPDTREESSLTRSYPTNLSTWIPTLRNPEDLAIAYRGQWESLTIGAADAAADALRLLDLPVGLDDQAFRSVTAAFLATLPAFFRIMHFIDRPRRFGEVRDLVGQIRRSPQTAIQDWQTMLRWILYFYGDRFEYCRPNYSEIIMPRQRLPDRSGGSPSTRTSPLAPPHLHDRSYSA